MKPTVFTDIAAEVEIPDNGTLSRVLYRDDQIRVVAFAFDTAQELTEHTATVPALIEVVRGRFRLTLGKDMIEDAGPGFWAHMPGGLPHSVEAIEPGVLLLTLLQAG